MNYQDRFRSSELFTMEENLEHEYDILKKLYKEYKAQATKDGARYDHIAFELLGVLDATAQRMLDIRYHSKGEKEE